MRLRAFQHDPQLALPLLELLKDDPEQYVRRSVANHLGDIMKDHPEVAYDVCERWLREIAGKLISPQIAAARRWLVRHAVRLPAKRGNERALGIRAAAR
jgi:3-methyladenine DNA glycosylase AlkC